MPCWPFPYLSLPAINLLHPWTASAVQIPDAMWPASVKGYQCGKTFLVDSCKVKTSFSDSMVLPRALLPEKADLLQLL